MSGQGGPRMQGDTRAYIIEYLLYLADCLRHHRRFSVNVLNFHLDEISASILHGCTTRNGVYAIGKWAIGL